jgi:surface antigen
LLTFPSGADASSVRPNKPVATKPVAAKKVQVSTKPATTRAKAAPTRQVSQRAVTTRGKPGRKVAHARPTRGGGISCVPYARSVTGMAISGNAWQWWGNAAGSYARGQVPEAGSVLAFRNNMRMPMGHVAVVSRVEGPRVVTIDHANWPIGGRRGAVSRGVAVVDVSENNDWSAVRVALGRAADFGSIYPTHGFIYNRPDTGTIRVTNRAPAPMLALNAPPRDLRSTADRNRAARYADRAYTEVAEAPPVASATAFNAPIKPYAVTLPEPVFNGGN